MDDLYREWPEGVVSRSREVTIQLPFEPAGYM